MISGVSGNKVVWQHNLKPLEDRKCPWHAQSFPRPANTKNNIIKVRFFIHSKCMFEIGFD